MPPGSGAPSTGPPPVLIGTSVPFAAGRRAGHTFAVLASLLVWLVMLAPLLPLVTRLHARTIAATGRTGPGWSPVWVSLGSAGIALTVLVLGGTGLAWMLATGRLPAPRVWEAGLLLMQLMPPLVIGLLLVFLVGPYTVVGRLLADVHLSATNTFLALVVAEVYEAAPYYVLGAQAAFAALDPRLAVTAGLLGDRPVRTFRRVSLPLAAPGLAAALAAAWARAVGAFGAVIIIAYHPYGLPLAVWTTLEEVGLEQALPYAAALLLVAVPVPLAAYLWSARARRRR
ncbi:MAG: ABC transporter permease subunit [Actinomycetes bacterium]